MATRSSKPASPAASWVRNHFICSRSASASSQANRGSYWPGPLSFSASNQAMKPSGSEGTSATSGWTWARKASTKAPSRRSIRWLALSSPCQSSCGVATARRRRFHWARPVCSICGVGKAGVQTPRHVSMRPVMDKVAVQKSLTGTVVPTRGGSVGASTQPSAAAMVGCVRRTVLYLGGPSAGRLFTACRAGGSAEPRGGGRHSSEVAAGASQLPRRRDPAQGKSCGGAEHAGAPSGGVGGWRASPHNRPL